MYMATTLVADHTSCTLDQLGRLVMRHSTLLFNVDGKALPPNAIIAKKESDWF